MSGFCKCVGWAAHMHPLCLVTYAHTADNQWEDKDVLMKGCKLCGIEYPSPARRRSGHVRQ